MLTPSSPSLRLLQRCGAILVLAWLGRGLAIELKRTVDRQLLHPQERQPAIVWRYGTPPLARLERFLARAHSHLPAGREVVFSSPTQGPPGTEREFFRFLWASYLLGDRSLIPSFDAAAAYRGELWVSFGPAPATENGRELVFQDPAGAVYRRSLPAPAPPPLEP